MDTKNLPLIMGLILVVVGVTSMNASTILGSIFLLAGIGVLFYSINRSAGSR